MRRLNRLHKGDKVTIVATARKVSLSEIQPAIDVLKSWGLVVVINPLLWKEEFQFAGSDIERAALLQWAINSTDIKAVFCARGGYGTVRMIDYIDFGPLHDHPKWICGFSDVTVLLGHLFQLGHQSVHSTMPLLFNLDGGEEALLSLKKILFEGQSSFELLTNDNNRIGKVTAPVVGGNLSVLYSMLGSRSFPDLDGAILFIEDVDEYIYHIDRMLNGLKRSGVLSGLKGLVVGAMTDIHDNAIPFGYGVEQIVLETFREFSIPILFDFPAGHISNNRALCFGANYTIEVMKDKSKLNIDV